MGVKVAATCLRWSQPYVPHSPSSSQALASIVPSPPLRRRSFSDGAVIYKCVQTLDRSFWGTNLYRSRSCDHHTNSMPRQRIFKQACRASLDAFSDEEFAKQIQEIATRFQLSQDDEHESEFESASASLVDIRNFPHSFKFSQSKISFDKASDWAEISENIIPANIEMKVNSVQLPHSLRIIRQKMQWEEGFREAGEFASCSVEKAFSSMVFIIHELHSFTLQMREKLFYEDLQGIIIRVQKETQASFVWLFQQVFSHTPTLMMYVMILLANYSVYSMSANAAIAAPPPSYSSSFVKMESVITIDEQNQGKFSFDSSTIKKFSVSSSTGKTSSIGGSNGGGGKYRAIASGTEGGDGESVNYQAEIPNGTSAGREEESVSGEDKEEEIKLWNSMVEEAATARDTTVDEDATHRFVSPVTAEIDGDEAEDYSRTELLYQKGLGEDPNNALLLANYAQFLYLVSHDYIRAEEYFKKAAKAEPVDAEALNKYATFLWHCKNDLWAAEETYLDAISADPTNSYYAANYAHFLWNTGGEETCYPICDDI